MKKTTPKPPEQLSPEYKAKVKKKLKKVLTVANIQNQKVEKVKFTGDFLDAFGEPQNRGFWFIWGGSGSGKSTFAMQTAKELAKNYKTLYNLKEEEPDDSDYIERTELCEMNDVADKFHTASYTLEELDIYLESRGSAKVIVIDSTTYFIKKKEEYKALKKKWATKKIFIWIGHADGKNPRTDLETFIMYDAKMKFFVSGYLATCKGRTIGANGGQYIVYKEGFEKLRGSSN